MSQLPNNDGGVRENDFPLKSDLVDTDRIRITTANENYNMTVGQFKDLIGHTSLQQMTQDLEENKANNEDVKKLLLSNPGVYYNSPIDLNTLVGGDSGLVIAGSPNFPSGYDYGRYGYIETKNQFADPTNDLIQIMYPFRHLGRMVYRNKNNNGEWGSWKNDGVETSGLNENGTYIKFSDGTQICFQNRASTGSWPTETSLRRTWVFPASFTSLMFADCIIKSSLLDDNSSVWACSIRDWTTVSMSFYVKNLGLTDDATNRRKMLFAIGRWK